METRHVKIDYESALSGKKYLLNSEINLLRILEKIRDYKELRKKELTLKSKLKTVFFDINKKIETIYEYIPKETNIGEKILKNVKIKNNIDKKIDKSIQLELEEIKIKLGRL